MSDYFQDIPPIKFEGKDSKNPLAFKYYQADRKILGKNLEDHLVWQYVTGIHLTGQVEILLEDRPFFVHGWRPGIN